MSKKEVKEKIKKVEETEKQLNEKLKEKKEETKKILEEIEKEEENLKDFKDYLENVKGGVIIEVKDGLTKLINPKNKKYKINQSDYVIPGNNYKIVDRDKTDIRPYVRYLSNNKKEKLRHNLIMYIAIGLAFTVFMCFTMKRDIKNIKEYIQNGNIENVENIKTEKVENTKTEKEENKKINNEPIPGVIEGKGQGSF